MDINNITYGQYKQLQTIFGGAATASNVQNSVPVESPYQIGENYIVRTVTMIFTGKLVAVTQNELILVDVSWIPETARYTSFVKSGEVKECEPYPAGLQVIVGRGAVVDAVVLKAALPRTQM